MNQNTSRKVGTVGNRYADYGTGQTDGSSRDTLS